MKLFSLLIIYFAHFFTTSTSQTCETWMPIPEADYNTSYVPINSPDANGERPLGFKVTNLPFGGPNPCFLVGDTAGNMRHIEVKWELALSGRLCVTQNIDAKKECNTGKTASFCGTVPGGAASLTYTFECTGDGCEGGDKQFWYRFVVEQMVNGKFDENWCSTRDSDYPSTLAPLPSVAPPTTTTKQGGASSIHLMKLSLFISVIVITCAYISL